MKALAIIVNIFLPGFGTLIVKKFGQGIIQIVLTFVSAVLILTGFLAIVGLPLFVAVWIWAIISAATAKDEPVAIVVKQQDTTDTSS